MKPILCIIDLTESSAVVLDTAVRITCAFKTYLIIIFPYRLIAHAYTDNLSGLKLKLEDDAKAKFKALKQQGEIVNHFSYEFRPEIGFTSDRITSFLKAGEAEMIVIGQQQATAMNELDRSTLQDLIRNSKLPFTIVPEISPVLK
jgi:hypothetical protein